MSLHELDDVLRQWGALSKYTEERKESGDEHVLHRNKDFAPGTRAKAAARLVGRDGYERRKHMARDLGVCGVRIVGASYVDPVPATQRNGGSGLGGAERRHIPTHLLPVDKAARALHRVDTLAGLCLRYEYCGYGSQSEKAAYVGSVMGSNVGLRLYREALSRGRGWMLSELARKSA